MSLKENESNVCQTILCVLHVKSECLSLKPGIECDLG